MKRHVLFSITSLLITVLIVGCATPVVSPSFLGLMNNLRATGAQVEIGNETSQPFFAVKGKIVKLNGNDVQVFEYADTNAANADAARVSRDGSSIGTTMATWMSTPHFFKKDNLIVLYVRDTKTVLDALAQVLGAQFAGR
jgi:hypothetical protein